MFSVVPARSSLEHLAKRAQSLAEDVFALLDEHLAPSVLAVGLPVPEGDSTPTTPLASEGTGRGYVPEGTWPFVDAETCARLGASMVQAGTPEGAKAGEELRAHVFQAVAKLDQGLIPAVSVSQLKLLSGVDDSEAPRQVHVFLVLTLKAQVWGRHYALGKFSEGDTFLYPSLIHAAQFEFLDECRAMLESASLGSSAKGVRRSAVDIVRGAARSLSYTPGRFGTPQGRSALFDNLNAISSLRYESRACQGKLVVCREGHEAVKLSVQLRSPVPMSQHRTVRKLLEIAGDEEPLVGRSHEVIGFGRIEDYGPESEDVFEVAFPAHFTWELRHAGHPLARVQYGQAQLPKPKYDAEEVEALLKRTFPKAKPQEVAALLQIAEGATQQRHGTMLVISDDAGQEAERLHSQGLPIEPCRPSQHAISRLTEIDGAVLFDSSGVCHAIGVILDGVSDGQHGDRARGARFNSGLRYLYSRKGKPTVVCIVSEDGMIDMRSTEDL